MTKSTITRERLAKIKSWRETYGAGSDVMLPAEEAEELARMALAAMDSEPVAYIFKHPAGRLFWSLTDKSNKGHDDVMPVYASPQPAPIVEREPIAWLNDAYLARGVVDGEAGSEDAGPGYIPVYRHAQPAPVVPEEITIETATIIAYGLPTTNIGAIFKAGHDACRAAMLQAYPVYTCPSGDGALRWPCPVHPGNSPAQSDCCPAQNGVNPEQKSLTPAQDGNHLVIPDGYVMVPEEMTDEIGEAIAMQANCCGGIALDIYDAMLAAAPQSPGSEPATVPGKWIPVSERMPETDGNYWGWWSESKRQGQVWFIKSELQAQFQSSEITHWMELPAAPQEAINALIPLVSRNEREGK